MHFSIINSTTITQRNVRLDTALLKTDTLQIVVRLFFEVNQVLALSY